MRRFAIFVCSIYYMSMPFFLSFLLCFSSFFFFLSFFLSFSFLFFFLFLSFFFFFSFNFFPFLSFSPSSQRLGLIPSFFVYNSTATLDHRWRGLESSRPPPSPAPPLREEAREEEGGVGRSEKERERQTDSVSRRMEEQFVRARVREWERERGMNDSEYMRSACTWSPD